MKTKKIILKVTEEKSTKQRRINIPKKEETLEEGDFVEVIKREIK